MTAGKREPLDPVSEMVEGMLEAGIDALRASDDSDRSPLQAAPPYSKEELLEMLESSPNLNLSNEEIDWIAESMKGGLDGFLNDWGWRQFARAILEAQVAKFVNNK